MLCLRSRLQKRSRFPWGHLLPPMVSLILALFVQLALAAVPHLFPSLTLFAMLPIAGVVMLSTLGAGRCIRRFADVSMSAPAFVLFNILFLWGIYIFVIRQDIPSLLDVTVNVQYVLLLFGVYRIFSSDPGVLRATSSLDKLNQCVQRTTPEGGSQDKDDLVFKRLRYCQSCSANILGYDHHCPAFGNCIGQKNHRLFMLLLIGFIITEASYSSCSTWFIRETMIKNEVRQEGAIFMDLATSTLLFALLQIIWQVVFLIWHVYCICFNIKTDEWINWKKYPEFKVIAQPQPGEPMSVIKFQNPYDKGILGNIKEFLKSK